MSLTVVGGGRTSYESDWHNGPAAHSPALSDAALPPSSATDKEYEFIL